MILREAGRRTEIENTKKRKNANLILEQIIYKSCINIVNKIFYVRYIGKNIDSKLTLSF